MNKYLAYQFVGKSEGLHKLPDHIQKIKKSLGFEEKERRVIEELIPQLKQRIRAQSIPEKPIPKQIHINNLSKKLVNLRQEYDKINVELNKHQSFRTSIKNPKTSFEQHFFQVEQQIQIWEEQKIKLSEQIKQIKKELFFLENQSDTYTSKKIVTNQSVLLSELVTIEKKIPTPSKLPKILNQESPMYTQPKAFHSDIKMLNNTNDSNLIDLLESDEDQDLRPRTRVTKIKQKQLPTLEQMISSLDQFVVKNDKLQPHKEALQQFRLAQYEKYLIKLPHFQQNNNYDLKKSLKYKRIKNIKYGFATVFFCFCLIKQTKISQQRYQLICYQYHQNNYQKSNQELIFFVNNVIAKQILFKFSRLQQLQKAEKKQHKIMIPLIAEEIVREILQKLTSQKFSNQFYIFLNSISEAGFYPLQNYHCEIIKSRFQLSKYFQYLLKECKKIVFFEFVLIKNIIFYGLFFKSKELFGQLKIDADNELINSVALILLELFLRTQQSGIINVNLKHFSYALADGPYVQKYLKELDLIKMKILTTLQIDDMMKPFIQMIEKQFINYQQ
ncbi:unnamed protein product [Paramecium sonneborni]|uniref:Uncharacterized protein n=1 Tax=Paramecium sonneborni TaxID=65129 RepID=A0A8S1L4R1_9CILI|nr:unnamed protein product [Paramecium sonneborni]